MTFAAVPSRIFLLIVAAGNGSRFGSDVPKQYTVLSGRSVLRTTIDACQSALSEAQIRVIIGSSHHDLYAQSVRGLRLADPVIGGVTRQESVLFGLEAIANDAQSDDLVLIHDAARPFVSAEALRRLVTCLRGGARSATLAAPVVESLRREDGTCVDRDGLWTVQTPQGFRFGDLLAAHRRAAQAGTHFTDDCSLLEAFGGAPASLVVGDRSNIKITTPEDVSMAERLSAQMMETRCGSGFDVHALDAPGSASSIRLCGVDVPHDRALIGHSDADVALHALTDALLGALSAGDIGSHFPPSDPQWKGKDSAHFLLEALRLLEERGGRLVHADLTLICEAPKVGPHRDAMRERIAALAGVSVQRISVKATTTERLGFTGRREGIAAQAVATILVPAGDS